MRINNFIRKVFLLFIFTFIFSCGGGENSEAKFTGRDLDLFAQDNAYLGILRPDGTTVYTRSSSFILDVYGSIVTSEGFYLSPQITIPTDADSITIDGEGTVSVTIPSSSEPLIVGTLLAFRFSDPSSLQLVSGGYFEETATSGTAAIEIFSPKDFGPVILQGYLEQ